MKTRMLIPVLLVTSLLAQTPPSTGSISGRVVDLETGTPLAGISVGSQSVGRAATDADGRYTLRNVSPGSVTVFVREANGGYTNMTLNLPKRVTVTSGRETTGVDFRVRMDAQISGRVLDENGEPVPGILVSVVQRLYSSVAPSIASSAVTDDRGVYVMTNNVFAGRDYYVLAQPSKRYANPISDLPAEPEARRRALVPTFYPSAGSVESAVAIIPKSLEHRTDVDIRMRKASNYCIAGVLHAGATPARMRFAIQDELVPTESPDGSGVPRPGGESGADGKIRVCDLYPGRFRLTAAQPASSSAFTSFSTATTVTISNADVSGLNVLTIPPLTVAGEIVWDKPPGDASFKPVIGITQNPLPGGFSRPSAQATVPGEFTLTMVPTVDYSLSIVAPAPPGTPTGMPASTYVKDITYGGSSVVNGWIRTTDSSAKLRIVVGNEGGSIGITAARADGSPAAGTAILILPATARNEVELGATLKEAYADDTGSYQITNVPPGLYYVLATDDPPAAQTNLPTMRLSIAKTIENLNFLLRARSGGQLIEVRPGAAVQVRVTPKPLQ